MEDTTMAHASSISHTILIVEDEQPLLEAIKQKLVGSGFEVVTAKE